MLYFSLNQWKKKPNCHIEVHMNDSRRMGGKMEYWVDRVSKDTASMIIYDNIFRACQLFEKLEAAGKLHGNGKFCAQEIAEHAKKLLEERWKNEDHT
jgi:hypothetical protein